MRATPARSARRRRGSRSSARSSAGSPARRAPRPTVLGAGRASVLALIVLVGLTGALHQDGLADCADALGVRGDRERRLAVMRDSGDRRLRHARAGRLGAAARRRARGFDDGEALPALVVGGAPGRWAALSMPRRAPGPPGRARRGVRAAAPGSPSRPPRRRRRRPSTAAARRAARRRGSSRWRPRAWSRAARSAGVPATRSARRSRSPRSRSASRSSRSPPPDRARAASVQRCTKTGSRLPVPKGACHAPSTCRCLTSRAGAASTTFSGAPALDGELVVDDESREAVATDLGKIAHHKPGAVLRPGSAHDIAAMIRFCRGHEIPVSTRGQAHTTSARACPTGWSSRTGTSTASTRSGRSSPRWTPGSSGRTWSTPPTSSLRGAPHRRSPGTPG